MQKQLTDHYLRLALLIGLVAGALWALVVLFGFGGLKAGDANSTAAALGLVMCFLVTFIGVVLVSGVYDTWKGAKAEEALETALWAAPVQRERLGFVLMAGSLLLLVSAATGAIAQPLWPALSGISLFGGGLVLVVTALQAQERPAPPASVWARRSSRSTSQSTSRGTKTKETDPGEEQASEEKTPLGDGS